MWKRLCGKCYILIVLYAESDRFIWDHLKHHIANVLFCCI